MRLRPFVTLLVIVVSVIATHRRAEGSSIQLFDDRAGFNAAVNGDYQLFTEFPINDLSQISSFVIGGNYGGLRFAQDFANISFGDTLGTGSNTWLLTSFLNSVTAPVSAMGFDLTTSSALTGSLPMLQTIPNNTLFSFETAGGMAGTRSIAPTSFFGVVVTDDVLSGFNLRAADPGCMCAAAFAIDNLAVRSVPEPATGILFGVAASLLFVRRRRQRT
jgi:hypothetical protein